jgi:hypothetical protein
MSTKIIHNKYQIEIRASNQDQKDQDHEMQGLVQEKEDQNHELLAPRVESMSIKTIIIEIYSKSKSFVVDLTSSINICLSYPICFSL